MAASLKDIEIMLRTGAGIGTCFGAEPTRVAPRDIKSELPPEERKKRRKASRDLREEFKW